MKKHKGMSLMQVLAVFFFVSILAMGISSVYVSTVKQSVYSSKVDQVNYSTISGLNIVTAYITKNNKDFLVKYDAFLSNNSNDRTKAFEIPLDIDGDDCVVKITSTYNLSNTTGQEVVTIVYHVTSTVYSSGADAITGQPVSIDITQVVTKKSTETIAEGSSTFTIGNMQ